MNPTFITDHRFGTRFEYVSQTWLTLAEAEQIFQFSEAMGHGQTQPVKRRPRIGNRLLTALWLTWTLIVLAGILFLRKRYLDSAKP